MWYVRFIILMLLWSPLAAHSANTHGAPNQMQEMGAWFGDLAQPYVVSGCVPATSASTTLAAFPCKAYVQRANGELVYVDQAAQAVGPLTGGDGAYWLAVHRDTSTAVSAWTRDPGSHYLWQKSASRPAEPADGLVIAGVTVTAGAVSAVQALGSGHPLVPVYTTSTLPTPGQVGRLARVTDGVRGIWQDTGTAWVRSDPVIDAVRDFGMVCDGTTDDAAALNAATAAAGASATYKTVRIGKQGVCILGTNVLLYTGMTLTGEGSERTILRQKANTQITEKMLGGASLSNVTVRELTLDGNYLNQGTIARRIVLLGFDDGINIRVENTTFINGYGFGAPGVMLAFGGTSNRLYVRTNHFRNGGTIGNERSDCIYASGFALQVLGNHFENCGDTAVAFESKSTNADNPADNTIISSNTFSGCVQSIGVSAAGAGTFTEGIIISNNYIEGHNSSSTGAIYFWPNEVTTNPIKKIAITGNVIRGTTAGYCISVHNASGVVISGNDCSLAGRLGATAAWTGIVVVRSSFVNIVGNTVHENGNVGINVQGGTDILLSANLVYDNCAVGGGAESGILIGQYALSATQSQRIKLLGNAVTGTNCNYGLNLSDTTAGVAILGNDFRGTATDGIIIGGSVTGVRRYGNLTDNGVTPVPQAEEHDGIIMKAVTFAELSGGTNGTFFYCSDCTAAATVAACAGAGSGALAFRANAAWVCVRP